MRISTRGECDRPAVVGAILATLLIAVASAPVLAADVPAAEAARVVAAGDQLPRLDLEDQHGAPVNIDTSTRLLLFSRDMDGGGHVKDALADGGRARLEARGAVYVADVSRMPGFVRSTFALPSMRKRPYPIALDVTGAATAALPAQDGKATILVLDSGRITSVAFAASKEDVIRALE